MGRHEEKFERIECLEEKVDFLVWKFKLEILLKAKGLLNIVVGREQRPTVGDTSDFDTRDSKAQQIIVLSLGAKFVLYVMNLNNSFEMWKRLEQVFDKKSECNKQGLLTRFDFDLRMKDGKDMTMFVSRVENLVHQLKGFDVVFTEYKNTFGHFE